MDLLTSRVALRRWTVASLVSNMTLIVTGGLVRVTQSGLGCSTWPQCEPGSYLPHPEAGAHAFIEFGNRLLTFVLVAVALGTLLAAWRARDAAGNPRRRLRALALWAGPGIPAQVRERLFQAFQSSARQGGTGLGLAIAAELVRAHGGDIAVQSSSDAGTCFVITIPDQVRQLRPGRSGERKVSLKA